MIQSANETGRLIMIAAGLRQIPPGGDPQFHAKRLKQDRHQIRDHDDAEQRVIVFRPAGEIGGPIAWIHVSDGDEEAGTGEGDQLAKETKPSAERRDCDGPPTRLGNFGCERHPAVVWR